MSWLLDEYLISFSLLGTSRPYNRRFSITLNTKTPSRQQQNLEKKDRKLCKKGKQQKELKEASMLEKLACVECMRRSKLCNTTRREEKSSNSGRGR